MKCNPLITRYRYSTLRRSRFGIYAAIYAVAIAVIFTINYLLYRYAGAFADTKSLFNAVFYQLLTVQVLLFVFWTCYNTAGAIPNEITERSYDFFRLLPLKPSEKSLGIMIGRNLAALLINGINFILLAGSAALSQVSASDLGQYVLALLGAAALMNTAGLLWSQRLKCRKRKEGAIGHVILLIIFVLFFMFFLSGVLPEVIEERVWFYGMHVPALLVFSFVTLYFAFWAFVGTLRRFRAESEPLFPWAYAFLFIVLTQDLICGLAGKYMADSRPAVALFWLLSVFLLLVVALLSFRNQRQYHELSGALHERQKSRSGTFTALLLRSNVFFSVVLFAVWFVLSMLFMGISAVGFSDSLRLLAVTCTAYMFFILLLEIYMLYSSGSARVGVLIFFLMALYVVLPLIIGGIVEAGAISGLSPVGLFWYLFDGPSYETPLWLIGAYNMALSVPPAAIIVKRYKNIVDAHG